MNYQAPMLTGVDYTTLNENSLFSLTDLEYEAFKSCSDFLEELKQVLLDEEMAQVHELVIAHLCAYLGAITTIHTVTKSEALEEPLKAIIKHQADEAALLFNQHPLNSSVSKQAKTDNLQILQKKAPGSIINQTIRLGRQIIDILEELAENVSERKTAQSELFCPVETLAKLMLLMGSHKCAEFREESDGLNDFYMPNQMAIQIGWLIGYFSHLDKKVPEKTKYFDYALPVFSLHRKHIFQLMETYANAVNEKKQQASDNEAQVLLESIHQLSEKACASKFPATTSFQKDIRKAHAALESVLIGLLNEGYEIKIVLMSIFYFWFTLEAPLLGAAKDFMDDSDPFSHMLPIIDLVKSTVKSMPEPDLSQNVLDLNCAMQALKKHLPPPEMLDNVAHDKVQKHTETINATIHQATCDLLQKELNMEAVAFALFSHWLRFSVFFGVSESEWQKMDFYSAEISKNVQSYLSSQIG